MNQAERELSWLRRARELSHYLVDEDDPSKLLPFILDSAIELAGAERGFLVRVDPESKAIKVDVARGFDGQSLQGSAGAVSRSVVQQVLERGERGVVTTRADDRELLHATTVRERRVLAILCVPMRLRGQTVGVIYLDHRFQEDAFQEGDIEPLRLFADQAALAVEGSELLAERDRAHEQLERAKDQLKAYESVERRRRRLRAVHRTQREAGDPSRLGSLVGESEASQGLFAAVERASRSTDPVLIVGESGSGKSQVAAELHKLCNPDGPLIVEHAARSDAHRLVQQMRRAAGGTLVLEDVGDATLELQAALVVQLQDQRAGAQGDNPARLVATTRQDLGQLVEEGKLREDLYYRLDVLRIDVPSLRDRSEDVPLLLDHVSTGAGQRLDLTPTALQLLVDHAWPGNLHELGNLVRRLVPLGKKITTSDLPREVREGRGAPPAAGGDGTTMADMERKMVVEALEACGGNKSQAARRLGIQRSTLYRLLDRYGLR